MVKMDLQMELKAFYAPSARVVQVVDVPRFQFVMIDGRIETGLAPGTSPGFQQAMESLYGAVYTLKFMSKLRKVDPHRLSRHGAGRPVVGRGQQFRHPEKR